MKYILILILHLLFFAACNQTICKTDSKDSSNNTNSIKVDANLLFQNQQIKYSVNADSVLIENSALFFKFKYEGVQYHLQNAVKFVLKVTNKGDRLIPDIQTCRWKGMLHMIINGQNAMQMSLENMTFGAEQTLAKDSTDTFNIDLQISGPDAVDYGKIFTYQWEYMGIKSKILQVNTVKRTIENVDKHIKNDKVIY
jgi:hypothetical protein